MSTNQTVLIVVLGLAVLGLLTASMMEYREESDLDWSRKYTLDSKDPNGAWMFDNMVKTYFDSNNVVYHYKDTLLQDLDTTGMLYIMFGSRVFYGYEETQEIIDFVSKGNSALIIGKTRWSEDSTYYLSDTDSYTYKDSVLNFTFSGDTSNRAYTYNHFSKGMTEKDLLRFSAFGSSNYYTEITEGIVNDTISVLVKSQVEKGVVYEHSVPEFFINHASKQDYYRDYVNALFGKFDAKFVVLDHPSFSKIGNRNGGMENMDSPIQFVLSQKALKTAYYLLLASCLLFVIFKSKRKQRAIPILEKNRNTSLEYVETLSNLFSSQGQSSRLIPHIKNYFYHYVKKKYYLDEKHPEFVQLLSRKSKFNQEELQIIINMLDNSDRGYAYPDDQLVNLHRRVENFYKTSK